MRTNAKIAERSSAESKLKAIRIIDAKLNPLTDQAMNSEIQKLDRLGSGMAAVLAGNQWYANLMEQWGFLERRPGFQRAVNALGERRYEDLEAAKWEIMKQVDSQKSIQKARERLASFLKVPGDSQSTIGRELERMTSAFEAAPPAALISPREQELTVNGQIKVPANYSQPTEEEVRLAFLRGATTMGGRLVDGKTAHVAWGPLEAMKVYMVASVDKVTIKQINRRPDGSYLVTYRPEFKVQVPEDFGSSVTGGKDYPQINMLKGLAELTNAAPSKDLRDVFQLTENGWSSPTIRDRALKSTGNLMDTLFSPKPQEPDPEDR